MADDVLLNIVRLRTWLCSLPCAAPRREAMVLHRSRVFSTMLYWMLSCMMLCMLLSVSRISRVRARMRLT